VTPSPALVNQAVTADASASYDDDGTSPIERATASSVRRRVRSDRRRRHVDRLLRVRLVRRQRDHRAAARRERHHVYATAGTYVVTVTVTDCAGQTGAASSPVAVNANVVGNPGFESPTSGWNTSGSTTGVTLARVDGATPGRDRRSWTSRSTTAPGTNVGSVTQLVPLTTAWQKASVNYTARRGRVLAGPQRLRAGGPGQHDMLLRRRRGHLHAVSRAAHPWTCSPMYHISAVRPRTCRVPAPTSRGTRRGPKASKEKGSMSIITILIIVVVVLLILGFVGRGRF
jgi:hypothetical protein